ncbi:MAG: urea ABC transporter substrate-binding protein, partial [Cyanothece sp. SIO2G6]|nr:urea ABC transporter substrate-binding protein [Cyanothece sp. SIO2G6]
MSSQINRRKFLIYSSTALGSSVLLKACGNPDTAVEAGSEVTGSAANAGETIKVGILHSLSGTMAISETT